MVPFVGWFKSYLKNKKPLNLVRNNMLINADIIYRIG